jgi:hypothetical protein
MTSLDIEDVEVVEEWIDKLRGVDSLADTPFSELFHEARTSTPDHAGTHGYSGVSACFKIDGGELTVADPVKTRQGEHLRGTDAYDGMLGLHVRPFMPVHEATDRIVHQLQRWARLERAKIEREEHEARLMEAAAQ